MDQKTFDRAPAGQPASVDGNTHSAGPLFFLMGLSKRGDVVPYDSPYGMVYLINHPDYIGRVLHDRNYIRVPLLKIALGEGLITSEGAYWRSQRRLAQPAFHQERIAAYGVLMTEAIAMLLRQWEPFANTGQPLEVTGEMTRLTLGIIGKALFGVDLNAEAVTLGKAITALIEDVGHLSHGLFGSPHDISPTRNRRLEEKLNEIDRIVYGVINDRHQTNDKANDLLGMFLSGRDQTTGASLNDRQLRDEVITMLLAGHETTANMLSWTWYLLSQHPQIERELHAELGRVLGRRLPTMEDLPSLPYGRMVLQESLRLFPPVWFFVRTNLEQDQFANFSIPAKSRIVLAPYTMHRHPAFWPDPERFDPERFTSERSEGRPHYAYFPFAGGHHLCLGNHLAMTEGQLVLASVAQRYRLRLVPGHHVEPEPLVTLRHRHGLPMTLVRAPANPSMVEPFI